MDKAAKIKYIKTLTAWRNEYYHAVREFHLDRSKYTFLGYGRSREVYHVGDIVIKVSHDRFEEISNLYLYQEVKNHIAGEFGENNAAIDDIETTVRVLKCAVIRIDNSRYEIMEYAGSVSILDREYDPTSEIDSNQYIVRHDHRIAYDHTYPY